MSEELTDVQSGQETIEEPVINDPKAVLAALERAKADAKKYREDAEALRSQQAEVQPDKYKDRAVKAEAKDALREKGIKNPDRILKHMNLSDLDFDEDGNLAGLEGRISEIQKDFPELFSAKHQAGSVEQFAGGTKVKELTASEKQAKALGLL